MSRRAGAPRLIDWTGERCVPWAPTVAVVYEHFHRYLWASQLVGGLRVLDLASGEGFGAAILAGSADSVLGIDIDEQTVEHSALNYGTPELEFRTGDAHDLSSLESGSFGAVVAFEMIEHVSDQDVVLTEILRLLAPDGLLIMSTPERHAYQQSMDQANHFHLRELTEPEFRDLLGSKFAHTAIWSQRTVTGSAISALGLPIPDVDSAQSFFIERLGDEWRLASALSPLFMVALASNVDLPRVESQSVLVDGGAELMRTAEAELRATQAELRATQGSLAQMQTELSQAAEELRQAAANADEQGRAIAELRAELRAHADALGGIRSELGAAQQRYQLVESSVTWQLFQRARPLLYRALGGEHSRAARAVQAVLRFVGRLVPQTGSRR